MYAATTPIGPALYNNDATAQWPIGQRAQGFDPDLNASGEFVYLRGHTNVIANAAVVFSLSTGQVVLNPTTAGEGPIAFALANCPINTFGWFQVGGLARCLCPDDVVAGAAVYSDATVAGKVDDAVVATEGFVGAKFAQATTGSPTAIGLVQINNPAHSPAIA